MARFSSLVAGGALVGAATMVLAQSNEPLFTPSSQCTACHNGLVAPDGSDLSIGADWRSSVMANAARDPYWQAALRREILDHPGAEAELKAECSRCHMPMANETVRLRGEPSQPFAHLEAAGGAPTELDLLALDGVGCSACHQIEPGNLGLEESFTGGFAVAAPASAAPRKAYGPFEVDEGRKVVMRSATGFEPVESGHVQRSELCATCHTLYTDALDPQGRKIGSLPEQVPYLEWRHSAYRDERSCQSCHMPVVEGETALSSVLPQDRAGFSRHVFRGGNFFMLGLFNANRQELGIEALPQELEATRARTLEHLHTLSAALSLQAARGEDGRLEAEVSVANLAGHKLPTAYPSRRAWLHLVVRGGDGQVLFESGALDESGAITGNDNDRDPALFEPHHRRIDSAEQVQLYEPILAAPDGSVTTGLRTAVRYAKDNRLLPRGFAKATAPADVAVHGLAAEDADFEAGGDRVVYSVAVDGAQGPFAVEAALWYQPIGFRWAHNLGAYPAAEPQRFVRLYGSMAGASGTVLARAAAVVE